MPTAIEKQVLAEGPFKELIADAVRVGDTVYLSGVVSIDDAGALLHEDDLKGQIAECYAIIQRTLANYDADLHNIVDETWFVTDMAGAMGDLEGVFTTRAQAFGGPPAMTQTCVEVSSLVMPGLLIEIKVIARV